MTRSALLTMILGACAYDTHFNDCIVRCTTDVGCPVGLTCEAGFCRTSGTTETCATALGTSPSCEGLAATCGPNADEDCCSTATSLPGGTFFRSYDVAGDGMYPSTNYPATVSPFVLDRFEITVGRFRKFVNAGMGTRDSSPIPGSGAHAKIPGSGWDANWNTELSRNSSELIVAVKCDTAFQSWTDVLGANEELPINCVTWYEAMAFCIWDGGYLPTEVEWNYVSSGGSEQRAYPWSSPAMSTSIDCTVTNYGGSNWPSTACVGAGAANVGSVSPAGDGLWGQADLGGNVWEWELDWYVSPLPASCTDCANLALGDERVLRGGGFNQGAAVVRTAFPFFAAAPPSRLGVVGVRCARAP